jgi:ribosomal protein S18 acetylase RimI-like enzyme
VTGGAQHLAALNLAAAMASFAHVRTGGRHALIGSLEVSWSGVATSVFNACVLRDAPLNYEELKEQLTRAQIFYLMQSGLTQKPPWSFWCSEGLLPLEIRRRLPQLAAELKLRQSSRSPVMGALELLPPKRKLPELEFRVAGSFASRRDFCHVMAVAFHSPAPRFHEIYDNETYWAHEMKAWIGYANGRAVCAAGAIAAAGSVGLYSVATLPELQRRGYGEAVLREAYRRVSEESGLRPSVLQASTAGASLYRRLGYRELDSLSIWVAE